MRVQWTERSERRMQSQHPTTNGLRELCLPAVVCALLALGCGGGDAGNGTQNAENGQTSSTPGDAQASNSQAPSAQPAGPGSSATQAPFEPLELLTSLEAEPVGINALAFAPDGQTFVTGGDTPKVWQIGNDEPLHAFEDLYPLTGVVVEADALAISADGSTLAIGGGDGLLHLFDLASREPRQSIEANDAGIVSIAFSNDGKTIATSGYDGQAKLWNGETGDLLKVFEVEEDRGVHIDLTPDGTTLVSAGSDALVWSTESGDRIGDLNLGGERLLRVMTVAFSPDGRQIATAEATADFENGALLWATDTRKLTGTLKHEFGVMALAYSPDGRLLATADTDIKARIWRIADGQLVQTIENDEWSSVDDVAWTSDGKILAVVTEGTIHFWGPEGAIETAAAAPPEGVETAEETFEVEEPLEKEVSNAEQDLAPTETIAANIFPEAASLTLATPATLELMNQAIDLKNLPRIEGGDYQTTDATQLSGLAALPLPEAREFYRRQLSAAGWKELEQTVAQLDSDESWLREFEKDGYYLRVFFNALSAPLEGQRIMFELLHTGNVDTRKLPMPSDAKKTYETPVMTSFTTGTNADTFVEACRQQFLDLGWTDQGLEAGFFGKKLTLAQNSIRLQVDVRASGSGTDVSYDVAAIED